MNIKYFIFLVTFVTFVKSEAVWRWECERGFCQKKRITPETKDSALSLPACRLFCSTHAGLWPQPTGVLTIGNILVHINPNTIEVTETRESNPIDKLLRSSLERFKTHVTKLAPNNAKINKNLGLNLFVQLNVEDKETNQLTYETNESYTLKISTNKEDKIDISIDAKTFFGARHGLETLGQLIVYDDIRNELQIPRDVLIKDSPVYPHRGILLDTARNFVSIETIKRTIDGMAASKLNTFHWHITDSQSFPYYSKSQPNLSKLGAYSSRQVYDEEDIRDLIEYAKERGVKIIPEFDAPAHVGEGWQDTDLLACFNKQPWQQFCVEPPCGQFDPTKNKLYDVLEDIYGDMLEQFKPDVFHMGGDEVSFTCWNSTDSITNWMTTNGYSNRTEDDFVKLWVKFQNEALKRVDLKSGKKLPIILWTSTLTKSKDIKKYLPTDRYFIQIWTTGDDLHIQELLENGYKLILSNYDALYLDCGFSGWVTDGNNWCSPYVGWQKVYENSPAKIAEQYKNQMLGAEATLWTEQADEHTIDSRLWPRAAAMAERLWAEPKGTWKDAEQRMLTHRERLVERGIGCEALEPQWCLQNEANCPLHGEFNHH